MACEQAFRQELRMRGGRVTSQREQVLAALHELGSAVSAEELYEAARAKNRAIDLSTVYRTLALLQELRMVSVVEGPDGEHRYDLLALQVPHLHLACQRCGHVQGIKLDEAAAFVEHLRMRFGFVVQPEQMVVPGLCERCAQHASVSQQAAIA